MGLSFNEAMFGLYLRVLFYGSFLLSLQRALTAHLASQQISWSILEMGFRFDLLTLAFLLIPTWPLLLFSRHKIMTVLVKFYLLLMWFLVQLIYAKDSLSFPFKGERLRWLDHQQSFIFPSSWELSSFYNKFLVLGTAFCLFELGRRFIAKVEIKNSKKWPQLDILLATLLLALCARGTLAPHHLAREHCEQLSTQNTWIELCLNPLWTIDK